MLHSEVLHKELLLKVEMFSLFLYTFRGKCCRAIFSTFAFVKATIPNLTTFVNISLGSYSSEIFGILLATALSVINKYISY